MLLGDCWRCSKLRRFDMNPTNLDWARAAWKLGVLGGWIWEKLVGGKNDGDEQDKRALEGHGSHEIGWRAPASVFGVHVRIEASRKLNKSLPDVSFQALSFHIYGTR